MRRSLNVTGGEDSPGQSQRWQDTHRKRGCLQRLMSRRIIQGAKFCTNLFKFVGSFCIQSHNVATYAYRDKIVLTANRTNNRCENSEIKTSSKIFLPSFMLAVDWLNGRIIIGSIFVFANAQLHVSGYETGNGRTGKRSVTGTRASLISTLVDANLMLATRG
jgi:hypothetical protein